MSELMKRREFITLLGGAAAARPLAARAQQPDPRWRVGLLIGYGEDDPETKARLAAFRQALATRGWFEGRNIRVDYRFAAGSRDKYYAFAKELVALQPDPRSQCGRDRECHRRARESSGGLIVMQVSTAAAINATLYEKLNYNVVRDIAPVATIIRQPMVMVVDPLFSAKTVPEFIAYAKANPGKINLGSPGIGTPGHVGGELFKMMSGVEMVHVPYRGGSAVLFTRCSGSSAFSVPKRAALVTIISVRPMIALSGVRSSWLMLETNCDLFSLAICSCWLLS